jgi:hypothetical protein
VWQQDGEHGLIVPMETPKDLERSYGPLEFTDEYARQEAHECFTKLLNLARVSGIMGVSTDVPQRAIYHLAELLLGKDASFEIQT